MTMSRELESVDFIQTLLSTQYKEISCWNDDLDTLTDNAKRIIEDNATALREVTKRYKLDILLSAMLDHAPHPQGRRYVAVVLRAASERGSKTVLDVAEAWIDCFFRGQLYMYRLIFDS